MLIKVFGIWLMTTSINHLQPIDKGQNCAIIMNNTKGNSVGSYDVDALKPCDEVAAEINKEILKTREHRE